VLLGLTALLCVAGAQAATRYVSPSGSDTTGDGSLGNPWKTINYALGQMASGDTLYMRGGTYAERIGSGVIPSGTSEAVRTILQNYSGEAVTLQPLSGSGSGVVYLSGTQKYITIRGDAPHKVVLDAVNLNSAALYLGGSATAPSTYIRFENVEIKNAPSSGVLRGRYCEFISCKIHHNGSDNLDHGLYVSSHHNLVEGCEIYNNSGYGIQNYGSDNPGYNIYRNNRFYNNGLAGIVVSDADYNKVYNNLFYDNGTRGIFVQFGGPIGTEVYNNTCYSNSGIGIHVGTSAGTGTIIRNNISYANGGGNYLAEVAVTEDHNLRDGTDPLFVSTTTTSPDFLKIQSNSPAKDQGTNASPINTLVTTDYWGDARPQGSAYDIGADEYAETGGTVTAPVFSPSGGSLIGSGHVAMTTQTTGATIRYTTDGSTPSPTHGTIYSAPVSISSSTTLKAIAYKTGLSNSSVTTGSYTITGGTTVISEDFAAGAGNFTPVSGTWTATGGQYALTSPSAGSGGVLGNVSVHNTSLTGDWTLAADCSATVTDTWDDFSVVFGYQDANNYYHVSFNEQNGPVTSGIIKVVAGGGVQLADITTLISGGTSYAVKVVKTGNTYQAYLNNNLVAWVDDSTFTSGKVGFGALNNGATFDNLVVQTPGGGGGSPPPAPASLTATAVSSTQVDLSWSDVSDETLYRLERDTGGGGYEPLTTKTANTTTHSDTTVAAGTNYTYQIRAENTYGNSSWTVSNSVTTPGGGGPVAYREVFPNNTGAYIWEGYSTVAGWRAYYNNPNYTAFNYGDPNWTVQEEAGSPTDLPAVNSNPASSEQVYGFVRMSYSSKLDRPYFYFTEEHSVDRADVTEVQWTQGNAQAADAYQVALRIGGVWYASTTTFSNAAVSADADYSANAEAKSLVLAAETTWKILNAAGGAPMSLGSDTQLPTTGTITGFGLYINDRNGTDRFDSFTLLSGEGGGTVETPVFNPGGGTYSSSQSVTITTATEGATIRYTTDGSTPSQTNGTVYSSPVAISVNTTLKAIAYKSGLTDSSVTSATYEIVVAAPAFNPGGGTYSSAQSVTITTVTSGATIRYTTDGSTPSQSNGTVYSSPVAISVTTTLKAIAYKSGMTDSSVTSATYTITGVPQALYREVFPNNTGAFIWENYATVAGWRVYYNNPNYMAFNYGSPNWTVQEEAGSPTNLTALNSNPASSEQVYGFVRMSYSSKLDRPYFYFTEEYSLNRASVTEVQWTQGNAQAADAYHVALRVDGVWYVSTTTFANVAVATDADYSAGAQTKSLALSQETTWKILNAASGAPMSLGSDTQLPTTGTITGFGLYINDRNGTDRFDSFTIIGTP